MVLLKELTSTKLSCKVKISDLAPLECSVQIDTFGKECISENKYLYYYRNIVPVPPLSMIDDLLCISNCGINSILMNSFINTKSSVKKLQFGVEKCHKIHCGKNRTICPPLYIDSWKTKKKFILSKVVMNKSIWEMLFAVVERMIKT